MDPSRILGLDDCDGHPERALSREEMLDDIMLYWLQRDRRLLRWSLLGGLQQPKEAWRGDRAHGVAVFPKEIIPAIRSWCEDSYLDIRHWTEIPRGGHFAALEQPELFVEEDVRAFFRNVR